MASSRHPLRPFKQEVRAAYNWPVSAIGAVVRTCVFKVRPWLCTTQPIRFNAQYL